ncbi:hypothetical protein K3495_g8335 [Podosphaera aphanis]|nr:hypothetical protein K3495_g8335 [Podosphaera aphanis]
MTNNIRSSIRLLDSTTTLAPSTYVTTPSTTNLQQRSSAPATSDDNVNDVYWTDRKYKSKTSYRSVFNKDKQCHTSRQAKRQGGGRPSKAQYEAFLYHVETFDDDLTSDEENQIEDNNDSATPEVYFYSSFFSPTHTPTALDGKKVANALNEYSALHAVTGSTPQLPPSDLGPITTPPTSFLLDRYSASIFQGIIPDSGAAEISTAGEAQFEALRRINPTITLVSPQDKSTVRFGDTAAQTPLGTTDIDTPFGPVRFHVLSTKTPFLLSARDMARLQIDLSLHTSSLFRVSDGLKVPLVWKWGHPWFLLHDLEKAVVHSQMLMETELRQIHRRFGHPSVGRLHKILSKAGHGSDSLFGSIEAITKFCHHCQMKSKAPDRFKFKLQDDDMRFNYEIIVDVFYLETNSPVLHVVDAATAYQAASFLKDISAAHTWQALRQCWIDVYLGPPDFISHDPGRNFSSNEFR